MKVKGILLMIALFAFCVGVTEDEDQERCDPDPQDFELHEPTVAVVGSNVTLSCVPHTFSINNLDDLVIEWKKDGEQIYLIKEKSVNHIKKEFKGRIANNISEMGKEGHASIRLTNLTKTDGGEYCCCIEQLGSKAVKCINHTLVITDVPTTKAPSQVINDVTTTKAPSQGNTGNWTQLQIGLGSLGVLGGLGVVAAIVVIIWWKEKEKKRGGGEAMELRGAASSEEEEKPNDLKRRETGSKSERDGLISRSRRTTPTDD